MNKTKKSKKKKFNLVKAIKKTTREKTLGLNLASRDHGDERKYDRNTRKSVDRREIDEEKKIR